MTSISVKNIALAIHESTNGKDGDSLNEAIEKSAKWIKEKNLINKKEQILKILEEVINKENSILKVNISSRNKLDKKFEDEIKEFIKKKYKAKEIILESKEEEKLLGGIKIEIGNDIIDTTLSNKLNQLQTYLTKN